MSTRFERALAHTLRFEGGFVDDPRDPGGATNYGISLRFLAALGHIERFDYDGDGDLDADDIRALSRADAAELYLKHFWSPTFDDLRDELLAAKLFDLSVNMGSVRAIKLLQAAANELQVDLAPLRVDGLYGGATAARLARFDEAYGPVLLGDLEDHAARFYYALAEKRRPAREFLFGWLRRAYSRAI